MPVSPTGRSIFKRRNRSVVDVDVPFFCPCIACMLARAPADRADRVWRRRGWLVILRKRTDGTVETCPKKQKSGVGGGQCLDMAMVAILAIEEGVFRNVVSFL